jgi:hypothetical protein
MVVVADLGTAHAREKFFGPIGASAVQAVSLLVIDALHFEAGMEVVPSGRLVGIDDRPLAMRERTKLSAWPSVRNTAGSELPLRSRTMTTARRLPDWLSAKRRSGPLAARLAGFAHER